MKLDSSGIPQWTQIFTGQFYQNGAFVEQTSDGGYIICGSNRSITGGDAMYLLKTNSNGSLLWNKIYAGGYYAKCVQQTNDSGYIIIGCGVNSHINPKNNMGHHLMIRAILLHKQLIVDLLSQVLQVTVRITIST